MDGVRESGGAACRASSAAGRPGPGREWTAARRFLLITAFLVGIWALFTAVADRASADEAPSGRVAELIGTVEDSGLTDPAEWPWPGDPEATGSGSDGSDPGSGSDDDEADRPDGTQTGPADEPTDPPQDTDPPGDDTEPSPDDG